MSRDFISNLSLPLVRNVLSSAVSFKGNTDARSTVELADVLLRSEVYNELHHVNDSRNMADFQLALDDMCSFLEVAGCTFPSESWRRKRKIISACVPTVSTEFVPAMYFTLKEETVRLPSLSHFHRIGAKH